MSYFMRLVDRDSNSSVELGIHSKMSLDDLQEYIHEHFNTNGVRRRVVGVFDDKMRVFYPLSFLLHSPRTFSTRLQDYFSVVYEDSTFMNEIVSAASNTARQEEDADGDESDEEEDDNEDTDYASETSDEAESTAPLSNTFNDTFLANVPVEFIDAHLKMLLDEVAARTQLKRHNMSQVFHALSLYADSSDRISVEGFVASVEYLDKLDPSVTDGTPEGGYSTYERMFNAIREFSMSDDEDAEDTEEDGSGQNVSIYRVSLFMSLFCSIGGNENDHETSLKMIYNLFDFNRDGFVTLSDAHNCFYMLIKSLLNLFPDVIFDIDDYPIEKVVSVLTESLFRGRTLGSGGNTILQFAYFQQWHRSRDSMVYLLVEAVPNPLMLQGLQSKVTSFQEARTDLGLEGILPSTLMRCLSHYSSDQVEEDTAVPRSSEASDNLDEFQFICRRGVFAAILLASKLESANNVFSADWQGLYNAEVIVCQIFSLYDISQAGYVDRNDIFAGLSVFCGEAFDDRVKTMFEVPENAKSQQIVYVPSGRSFFQTPVNRSQMIEYLLAVLKAVLLFGDYDLDDTIIQSLAVRMISDALAQETLPALLNGAVSTIDFAAWLEVVINIKQNTPANSNSDPNSAEAARVSVESRSEDEDEDSSSSSASSPFSPPPPPEASVAQELEAVKRMMGFTGFTAEDVMDLLGEVSREGMISEFSWFQAVSNMCAFNSHSPGEEGEEEEEDRMDEALLFAEKIFNGLAALYPAIESDTGERLVNYSLLLSAVTVLCDCPAEDKMFTAFMMLSDSTMGIRPDSNLDEPDEVTTFASVSNVTDYFRGVFALLCAVSPAVQDLTDRMNLSPDDMAIATLQCTMAQNNLNYLPDRGFDIDQFSALAWTCMDM